MLTDSSDSVAVRLTAHIDGLGQALTRARVPLAERARLLELAALAALEAVTLEAVNAPGPDSAAPATAPCDAPSLRAAAA